jgi:uncharacterized protein YaiI (UPF0178 family)
MKETNPVTEEVKKVAEETGAQVENVAEGTISKEQISAVDKALSVGADMVIKTLEMEGVVLTEKQKDKARQAYQASFAITALLMK